MSIWSRELHVSANTVFKIEPSHIHGRTSNYRIALGNKQVCTSALKALNDLIVVTGKPVEFLAIETITRELIGTGNCRILFLVVVFQY